MYNRYQGNTGKFIRLPEPYEQARDTYSPPPAPETPPPPPEREPERKSSPEPQRRPPAVTRRPAQRRPPAPQGGRPGPGANPLGGLLSGLSGAVSGRLGSLETEDLLLLAIVYLMYRESGDAQLLVVMAALLLF